MYYFIIFIMCKDDGGKIIVDKITPNSQATQSEYLQIGCELLRINDDFIVSSNTTKKDVISQVKKSKRPMTMYFESLPIKEEVVGINLLGIRRQD